jgi:hypothetical protein
VKTIPGFDYQLGKHVELTRPEWRLRAAGASNVVQEHSETMVYAWNKREARLELDAEIYAQGVLK